MRSIYIRSVATIQGPKHTCWTDDFLEDVADFHSRPFSSSLFDAVKFCSRFPLLFFPTTATYLLDSLERFRYVICVQSHTLSASPDSPEPWGVLNILSQPFTYHSKRRFSQQVPVCFRKQKQSIKLVCRCFEVFLSSFYLLVPVLNVWFSPKIPA